jgi:hypothetical protein
MALRRFMCFRGTPSRFQSDRGEQLVAAAKQVSSWDFKEVIQWTGKKGIEWILVPAGGQRFNRQAERMIGLIKKQIWRSFEGRKYSHKETITILQEAAQVINSRPLSRNPWPEGEPLCPQDLMLGRAPPGQPEVKFETGRQLTRRFENVQGAKEEFWSRWIREVFPELLKQAKWTKDKRDVKIEDKVLRKDETAAGQTYKYARVIKVHVGMDGRVRVADIEYRLPGETRYRTTTRPIHKMVLIIPVEEQIVGGSEEEAKATGPETRNPEAMNGNEAQKAKEDKPPGHKRSQGETDSENQVQEDKPSKKGGEADPYRSRYGSHEERGNKGCRNTRETKKRKTKEAPEDRLLGSTQGECSGPWEGSMRGSLERGCHFGGRGPRAPKGG